MMALLHQEISEKAACVEHNGPILYVCVLVCDVFGQYIKTMMNVEICITQPDDFHLHLRDGSMLAGTVAASAYYFSRAIIMPNLVPPVTTVEQAAQYKQRIETHIPQVSNFMPLMTLFLTQRTTSSMVEKAKKQGDIYALKLYPHGVTTHSDSGIVSIESIYPIIETMINVGLPLLVHGESHQPHIDIFDREAHFIEQHLVPLVTKYPELRLVIEHITTKEAIDFVKAHAPNVAATITPQHLLFNRNDMLVGGIRPHLYCLPILKRQKHQKALLEAAISGIPSFFLGTDSAPHVQGQKESACGCAGCFSAGCALELYAHVFESLGALDRLEAFTSFYGAEFYGLKRNTKRVLLRKTKDSVVPKQWKLGEDIVVPLYAGQPSGWSVVKIF